MKPQHLWIFIIIGTSIFLSSCQQPLWVYNVEVLNPGSKSEGKRGHLSYKEQEIKRINSRLLTPIGLFEYRYAKKPWEDHGWFQLSPNTNVVEEKVYLIDREIWVEPEKLKEYYD